MEDNNNRCVCCGTIIPEGIQYCLPCYEDSEQIKAINISYNKSLARKEKRKKFIQKYILRKKV